MIIFDRKFYKDFLEAGEGISTNILADRLQQLENQGMIRKQRDEQDRKRFIYTPTTKGLDLIPVLIEMMIWSGTYDNKNAASLKENIDAIKKDKTSYAKKLRKRFETT